MCSSEHEKNSFETMLVDRAITEAEQGLANGGQLHDAREALAALRAKHFPNTVTPAP